MSKFRKTTATIATSFGAALGVACASPSVQADVIDLTGNLPGTLSSTRQSFNFIGGASADWLAWNDASGRSVTAAGFIQGVIQASIGNVLTAGAAFVNTLTLPPTISGIATFGFATTSNQLGWIQVNFGAGAATPITYVGAAFENIAGNSITIGNFGTPVPEPNSLGLGALAALAVGASSRRRKAEPTS